MLWIRHLLDMQRDYVHRLILRPQCPDSQLVLPLHQSYAAAQLALLAQSRPNIGRFTFSFQPGYFSVYVRDSTGHFKLSSSVHDQNQPSTAI